MAATSALHLTEWLQNYSDFAPGLVHASLSHSSSAQESVRPYRALDSNERTVVQYSVREWVVEFDECTDIRATGAFRQR